MTDELYLLWTNDNILTSEKMVCMYAHNAKLKGWWKEVTVIVWGATAKLVAENSDIQDKLKQMMSDGVKVSACRACAEPLGVTEQLESLGLELKYWGEPLTEIIKSDRKLITV